MFNMDPAPLIVLITTTARAWVMGTIVIFNQRYYLVKFALLIENPKENGGLFLVNNLWNSIVSVNDCNDYNFKGLK